MSVFRYLTRVFLVFCGNQWHDWATRSRSTTVRHRKCDTIKRLRFAHLMNDLQSLDPNCFTRTIVISKFLTPRHISFRVRLRVPAAEHVPCCSLRHRQKPSFFRSSKL